MHIQKVPAMCVTFLHKQYDLDKFAHKVFRRINNHKQTQASLIQFLLSPSRARFYPLVVPGPCLYTLADSAFVSTHNSGTVVLFLIV